VTGPVLEVRELVVEFLSEDGPLRAVDGVSLSIGRGEIVGLVGESGAGKTLTSEAILGLIRCPPGRVRGEVRFRGRNLLALPEREMARIRGKEIAMIFQNPAASLNPVFRVGDQLVEALGLHLEGGRGTLRRRAVEILARVGIPAAARRAHDYPHQFSGGMAQRVMIGMGVACVPRLLIADEPTTALDVTIQAQILRLLRELVKERGVSVLFTTHDLGTAHEICDRVVVMYAGQEMESAPSDDFFHRPAHPYTRRLLESLPGADGEIRDIPGEVPSLIGPPPGCRFHPRCDFATAECRARRPDAHAVEGEHRVRCYHPLGAP